jgi:hypothetical protein
VTLSGSGTADLYVQATGDAASSGGTPVGFARGVRQSTINLPATHASIIGVGCTINKAGWRNVHGVSLGLVVPGLDPVGGTPDPGSMGRDPVAGEPCWFSSAGPTLAGLQKPEIMAPGAAIIGAMSAQAHPPAPGSIFTNLDCPAKDNGIDPACQQVDGEHAASYGTSFSSPIVARAIAALFQHDPTLTQSDLVAVLQGGAHPLRGAASFQDQTGAGEVDVGGAVSAADRLRNPKTSLPVRAESWLTLGADSYLADGSTPMQAIVELRAARAGATLPLPADGFAEGRLAAYALVDGGSRPAAVQSLVRRGPGVWVATVGLPGGLGGKTLTVGATFDGDDIVAPKSVPIATDAWSADYPPSVGGGCAVAATRSGGAERCAGVAAVVAAAMGMTRKRIRRQTPR